MCREDIFWYEVKRVWRPTEELGTSTKLNKIGFSGQGILPQPFPNVPMTVDDDGLASSTSCHPERSEGSISGMNSVALFGISNKDRFQAHLIWYC